MARQTKIYQVKFETKGFESVARALDSVQKGIRNAAAESLRYQARKQDISVIRSQSARERDRDIFGGKFVKQGEGQANSRQSIIRNIQEGLGFKQESQAKKEGLTFGSAFLIGVADALEVRSPSKAMYRLGEQAAIGFREGFQSVHDNFSESLNSAKNNLNSKFRPRSESGRFVSGSSDVSQWSSAALNTNISRLNRSIERLTGSAQKISRSVSTVIDEVRPKSEEEILSREFDKQSSGLSPQNRALAQALRIAMKEQSLQLGKAIEESRGGDDSFTPMGIASGIIGNVVKPFEAVFFGAFNEIGAQLTTELGQSLSKKLSKASGLDFAGIGEDIGQIIGSGLKNTIEETLAIMREAIDDESEDTGKYVMKTFQSILSNTVKTLFQTPLVATRAVSRMTARTQAIPQVKERLGNKLANQQMSEEETEKINQANSITIVVGGVNMDPDATSTDYSHAILEHGIEGSHVVPMRNMWSNQETSPEFQSTYKNLLKKILKNPEIMDQVKQQVKSEEYRGELDPFQGLTEEDLTDIDTLADKMAKAQMPFVKVLESFLRGYNPDDVEIASQIAYYRQKFPDKPINVIGTSFGGFNAAGAKNLVDMMGIPDVRGTGITTPFQGFGVQPNEDEFLGSIGTEDPLYKMISQFLGGLLPEPLFNQTVEGAGEGHLLGTYLTGDRSQAFRDAFNSMFAGRGQLSPGLTNRETSVAGRATKNNEFARAIMQMFGKPIDNERYAFKPDDLRYFIQEQKQKIKKTADPKVKERETKIVEVLEQLASDLDNFYKTREVGLSYKPVDTLQAMAEFIPSLEGLANEFKGKDFADQNIANVRVAESRPETALKKKLREESFGIERTVERLGSTVESSSPVVQQLRGILDNINASSESVTDQAGKDSIAAYVKYLEDLIEAAERKFNDPSYEVPQELLDKYDQLHRSDTGDIKDSKFPFSVKKQYNEKDRKSLGNLSKRVGRGDLRAPFDDQSEGWSFYHPDEPIRTEYLQGLSDHLQTIAPGEDAAKYLEPYLAFLQKLKLEIQKKNENPEEYEVDPELQTEYKALFGKGAVIDKPVPVKNLSNLSKEEIRKIEEDRKRRSAPPPLPVAPDPSDRIQEIQSGAEESRRRLEQQREADRLIKEQIEQNRPPAGQTRFDRPIPPEIVPDPTPEPIRSLLADAQARFQQMRPSQLAANQEPQARFPVSEELPQLIQAYQRSILEAFERSQEEMLRSLRDTIANLAQAPVESDQEGFSETIRSSLTEQARKLVRTYAQAINAIIGVSADPSTINQGNFGSEFEQLKEDTAAIMLRFREGIAQNFQETAALMQSLAQSYESESPAQLAGGKRQPYTEDFNEIIQNQLTEYQQNIRKLFADVAQSTAADFTDLRRLRAQLGVPAQAPKAGLSTRYNDRIQQLISGARTSAQERVRGLIPGFQELSPQQRSAELKKMRSQLTQGLAEFRSTMATGDQNAARRLGEGLLQRIEAIRAAYEDLGKNFTGDKRGLGAQKGQLTNQSKEIQARLKSIADNATGSLAAAIEADLGEVGSAGQSIGDALIEGAEDSLEISSPSQVFQRIGENVVQGFQEGLSNLADSFNELNQDLPNVDPDIFNIFSDLSQAAQDEISGFDANVAEGLRMVQEQVESLIQQFPILNNLLKIGSRLGGSIALGMAAFSTIGLVFKQAGIGKFFDAIATLPDTSGEAGRELQSLGIAFESVTGSSALAADAMQYVSDTAEKFGINIRAAEEAYLGLVATTRGTELEGFQTQKIFEAFAQTAALRGLDQQQQQQMFVAVQQVLGKGKLSAEEVRGQLGEIPALAFQQTLASSLGVNLQQLDKLLSTGQLQSDALFKVAQAYESANAQMSGASETATAALARFDNAIVKLQRSVGAEFLAVQTQGAKAFTSALNGITNAIPAIVNTIKSGLILVIVQLGIRIFTAETLVRSLRIILIALINLIQRLVPLILKFAFAIATVNAAWEVWVGLLEPFQQDETGKAIRNLSLRYQELAGSIQSAADAQKELENTGFWNWLFNFKERSLDIADFGKGALFKGLSAINSPLAARFATSAREEGAYNRLNLKLAESSEQISTTATAQVLNKEAIDAAEKMLKIQQQINLAKTIASGLSASDAEGLAAVNESLKELRSQYDVYLKQIGDVRAASEESIKNAKEQIKILEQERENPYLGDYAKTQIDQKINGLLEQIELLQSGQKELDAVTSRFEVTLADFATGLKRGIERLANFRERLTNQINEERARLLETGLGLGKGEQTIRLELDRQDFRELQEWVRALRLESQKITERLRDPILADQERNLREQADREGVDFGTAFLQRIKDEKTQNVEAAEQLLELQNLQNQITEGEVQLQQQALQARQSVRDLTRGVTDFFQQLQQEFKQLQIDLREQLEDLKSAFRRSQLQKAIVAGSTGLFTDLVSGVQGLLDQAADITKRYLGQQRRQLELEQRRYDLVFQVRDFADSLSGATEAVQAFQQALVGGSATAANAPANNQLSGAETLVGITGSTGIGTGAHLDIRKRQGDRRLTAAELNRFIVNGKPLGQQSDLITSDYGPRVPPVPGASDFHRGIDFGFAERQRITTTVPVKSVKIREPHETGGGGYVVDVLFEDGLEISLLHQSPEIKTAGIGQIRGGSPQSASVPQVASVPTSSNPEWNRITQMAANAGARFPELVAAQWALESGWGQSLAGKNNPFGLKGPGSQANTWEVIDGQTVHITDSFLNFNSVDEAVNYLVDRWYKDWNQYQGVNNAGDRNAAARMLTTEGYATDPSYAAKLIRLMEDNTQSTQTTVSQGAQSVPSGDVQQGEQLAGQVVQSQADLIATEAQSIQIATQDLQTAANQFLAQTQRQFENIDRQLIPQNDQLINQLNQYANPDQLREIRRNLDQEFVGLTNEFQTQIISVQDSITNLQNAKQVIPGTIAELRSSGVEAEAIVADSLQELLDMLPEQIKQLEEELKELESYSKKIESTKTKEQEYRFEQIRLQNELRRLQVELQVAEGNRNIEAVEQISLQILENEKATERLQIERDLSSQTEERNRLLEQQDLLYDQQAQSKRFEAQGKLLEEQQFQLDLQSRLREAQSTQAEGQFGDNGIFGFRATALREENALLQENLRYRQEVLAIEERYRDPAQKDLLDRMLEHAAQLNQLSLQNIDAQFKDLGETIAQVAEDALGQFFEDIFSGTKSAGEAFRNLAQSILRYFAQMAARNLARGIFSKLGGAFGGFFGGGGGAAFTSPAGWSGFAYGGTVPNYAEGDRVVPDTIAEVMRSLVPGVNAGFRREGSRAALGIFTPGEEILSLRTGEAQRYQLLKRSLGKNPLQAIMSGSFAYGGTVGINPDILTGDLGIRSPLVPVSSVLQMQSHRGGTGGGNVIINYEVKTPDANSFRRSQYQIDKDATIAAKQVLNRK